MSTSRGDRRPGAAVSIAPACDKPQLDRIGSRAEEHLRRVAGDRLDECEGAALAANTWKQYASTIALFQAWCGERRLTPMPAEAETVKAWIRHLALEGYANATIRAYLCGLSTWHRIHGHDFDRRPFKYALKGLANRAARQRKARPLLRDDLAGILAMLDPARPKDARDGALLSVGWANALRRSEIIGLDWQRRTSASDGAGVLRLTAEGLSVELLRSKSAQDRAVMLDVPKEQMPSAIAWLHAWAAIAQLKPGEPVFRMLTAGAGRQIVSHARLSDHSAAQIVRDRMIALEISRGMSREEAFAYAQDFSGHSLRAGYCTSAAEAGTPEYLIRERSRHRSAEIVAGYVRAAENRRQHGLGKVGL